MHSCWLADKVNWSSTRVFQLPSPSIRVGSKLLWCKKKFAPESICNGTLPYFLLLGPQTTDTQWDFFFKYLKYFGQSDRSAELVLRYFRVFWVELSAQILSLCICNFELLSHFFCKKLGFSYILQDFLFGIGIWIWAVENLRSIHHVSAVCDLVHTSCSLLFLLGPQKFGHRVLQQKS